MEQLTNTETDYSYSPSALLNLFSNSLNIAQVRKMVNVKGVYLPGNNQNYNGFYYDSIRDEASDASMKLIVPQLIRNELTANKTISIWGYITKKVVNNGGRIELLINVTELVAQTHNKYNEEDIEALTIQKQKAESGYRDVDGFLKKKILNGEKVRIKILVGKTAIIDSDIKDQLAEAVNFYQISFDKASFVSETDIIQGISRNDSDNVDILVISRGGGENLEIFNKPGIAKRCLDLKPYLISAIGHKEDIPLLERIADKSFIVPAVFGRYLNDVYNETVEELQNSRAKLIDDITKTLRANFEKQVQNLTQQLEAAERQKKQLLEDIKQVSAKEKESLEKVTAEKIAVLNQTIQSIKDQQASKEAMLKSYEKQVASLQQQLSAKPEKEINWGVIVVGIIIGIIIGVALAS